LLDESLAFLKQDPEKEAYKAIANNDYRFLGVMSYSVSIPGIDARDWHYIDQYGCRIIDGTSDFIANSKIQEIMRMAPGFCERYNKVILNAIKKNES
jgi:hypothetical protein